MARPKLLRLADTREFRLAVDVMQERSEILSKLVEDLQADEQSRLANAVRYNLHLMLVLPLPEAYRLLKFNRANKFAPPVEDESLFTEHECWAVVECLWRMRCLVEGYRYTADLEHEMAT